MSRLAKVLAFFEAHKLDPENFSISMYRGCTIDLYVWKDNISEEELTTINEHLGTAPLIKNTRTGNLRFLEETFTLTLFVEP